MSCFVCFQKERERNERRENNRERQVQDEHRRILDIIQVNSCSIIVTIAFLLSSNETFDLKTIQQ
jgi:hypothetical protein